MRQLSVRIKLQGLQNYGFIMQGKKETNDQLS